jgi:hypothetical protein
MKDGMSERKRAMDGCRDDEFCVVLRHLKDIGVPTGYFN